MLLACFVVYCLQLAYTPVAAPIVAASPSTSATIDTSDPNIILTDLPLETVGWHQDPDGRGTFGLVTSCVITLTLCVWSALHLNVPPAGTTLRRAAYTRTKWVLVGIVAPELLVATAFAQYITARWLYGEIKSDVKWRQENGIAQPPSQPPWTMMQCYFATMGGLAIQTRASVFEGSPRLTLSAEGARLLSFLNKLPVTQDSEIRDKSKADWLAKALVCIQAFYIIIQTIARVAAKMPITLLEVNTIGHVICALTLYLLWWNKPLELDHPLVIPYEPDLEALLSLMWMCSPISERQGVSEIRCMKYKNPTKRSSVVGPDGKELPSPESPQYTNFSVGSRARVDPKGFIGVAPVKRGIARSNTRFDYTISEKHCDVSSAHQVFMETQTPNTILQHAPNYCRWAQADIDCSRQPPVTNFELERWRFAGHATHELWEACQHRDSYINYYFTTSSLGVFLGETYYVDDHIKNFAGLSYLGHVNVHRDHLKSILAFTAAAYGGLHVAAWKEYFPTPTEKYLWIVSSIFISCTGVLSFLLFLAKQKIPAFDRWMNSVTSTSWLFWRRRAYTGQSGGSYAAQLLTGLVAVGVVGLFVCARCYLVVEAFVSLRSVPKEIYDTPNWTNFFPHL